MKENRIITEAHQEQQITSATLHLYDKNRQNTLCLKREKKHNRTIWHNIIQYLNDERWSSKMKIV